MKIYKLSCFLFNMPHQCIHCSKMYPDGSREVLQGCICGSHFFFYINDEQMKKVKDDQMQMINFSEQEKKTIEKDVRDIMGIVEEDAPVVLDLESVRVLGPGKFEIDLVNLFKKDRPIIYKLEEGKYIIDLASTFKLIKQDKSA